jgi:hypothetical protein
MQELCEDDGAKSRNRRGEEPSVSASVSAVDLKY